MKKIVVIGGGTGTATVLSSLVEDEQYQLTAIVAVSDSGGSTGRLRDEFGFIAVGDVRQCLRALATGENSTLVRDLLLYRFPQESSLTGHSLGNLILTALTDLYHTPGKAIEAASKILRIAGKVYPVSETPADLVIDFADGSRVVGEDYLNYQHEGQTITKVSLTGAPKLYEQARLALLEADLIIIGPGDLYASLLPNTLVAGFSDALGKASAPYVYIANLMTNSTQTHNLTAGDHLREITVYSGRCPDYIIINNQPITDPGLIASYQEEGASPLVDDLEPKNLGITKVKRAALVAQALAAKNANDNLPRNYLRHHEVNLRAQIKDILHDQQQAP